MSMLMKLQRKPGVESVFHASKNSTHAQHASPSIRSSGLVVRGAGVEARPRQSARHIRAGTMQRVPRPLPHNPLSPVWPVGRL